MCQNGYLHMPVVDDATGRVVGVVDVMEIIEVTVGQEGSAGYVEPSFRAEVVTLSW